MQMCEITPLGSATWSRAHRARLTRCTRTNQHTQQQALGTRGLRPPHSGSITMDNGSLSRVRNEQGPQTGHRKDMAAASNLEAAPTWKSFWKQHMRSHRA